MNSSIKNFEVSNFTLLARYIDQGAQRKEANQNHMESFLYMG